MARALEFGTQRKHARDARAIGLVSAAHFVSHFYILLLPPLFPFVRAEYGVTYTELGAALARAGDTGLTELVGADAATITAERWPP